MKEPHAEPGRQPGKFGALGGVLALVCFLELFIALAYLGMRRMPNLTEPGLVLLSGLGGVVGFSAFVCIASFLRFHLFKHRPVQNATDNILRALGEIARGNFNFSLESHPRDPHPEITHAFNEMAHNLGSLEAMRQDFISNVSHEIQSPLTSIKGYAALLQDDSLSAAERRRYAEIIEAESKRLSSLSDHLLKLSALDGEQKPLHKIPFRLDKQLQSIALTLEPQWAAKGITLEADLAPTTMLGDEQLLWQVWMNLLHNAVKFTQEGGTIHLCLDSAQVEIRDTGCGIQPADMPHIFERFYKADKSRNRSLGGSGLGLALVKRILDLHGLAIAVESEAGKGTRFTIRLH